MASHLIPPRSQDLAAFASNAEGFLVKSELYPEGIGGQSRNLLFVKKALAAADLSFPMSEPMPGTLGTSDQSRPSVPCRSR